MENGKTKKPLSAYGLFFCDTIAAIKDQKQTIPFQQLSKTIARMWNVLDPEHKEVYQKATELAKKEYLAQVKNDELNCRDLQTNSRDTLKTDDENVNQPTNEQQNDNNLANNTMTATTTGGEEPADQTGKQVDLPDADDSIQICVRKNCTRPAIKNPGWDNEYCSNECLVIYCREEFNAWVRLNFGSSHQEQQQDTI